jgi:PilZ domain
MDSRERRIDTRVNITVPFRFRVLNNPGATEQVAESINISQRGLLFATTIPLNVGTPLEVSLKIPKELAGPVSTEVRCLARVVHVQPSAFFGGKAGIGLHIEGYKEEAAAREVAGVGVAPGKEWWIELGHSQRVPGQWRWPASRLSCHSPAPGPSPWSW